jgi:hypothetical protein
VDQTGELTASRKDRVRSGCDTTIELLVVPATASGIRGANAVSKPPGVGQPSKAAGEQSENCAATREGVSRQMKNLKASIPIEWLTEALL